MMMFKVNAKAMAKVQPKDIRMAFKDYASKQSQGDAWDYQVLSVRGSDKSRNREIAEAAHALLASDPDLALSDLPVRLRDEREIPETVSVSVSSTYHRTQKEISSAHQEILEKLVPGSCSEPIAQLSRADKSTVYRVFYLDKHKVEDDLAFNDVENKIKNELLQVAMARETNTYLSHLRQHFGISRQIVHETLPSGFQPFSLN